MGISIEDASDKPQQAMGRLPRCQAQLAAGRRVCPRLRTHRGRSLRNASGMYENGHVARNPSPTGRRERIPLLLRIAPTSMPGRPDVVGDLTAGGLFVQTSRNLEAGAHVPLLLCTPGLEEPLQIDVEIAWRRPAEQGQPAGVAVKLLPDRTEDLHLLERLTARPPPVHATSGRSCRILVVEDNVLVGTMYGHALDRLKVGEIGIVLEHARDGVEALARLKRIPPRIDLLVTDLYMPVMDGFSLVQEIRRDPKIGETPILAISAGSAEARERAVEVGANEYLQKPFRTAEMLRVVRALLKLPP